MKFAADSAQGPCGERSPSQSIRLFSAGAPLCRGGSAPPNVDHAGPFLPLRSFRKICAAAGVQHGAQLRGEGRDLEPRAVEAFESELARHRIPGTSFPCLRHCMKPGTSSSVTNVSISQFASATPLDSPALIKNLPKVMKCSRSRAAYSRLKRTPRWRRVRSARGCALRVHHNVRSPPWDSSRAASTSLRSSARRASAGWKKA